MVIGGGRGHWTALGGQSVSQLVTSMVCLSSQTVSQNSNPHFEAATQSVVDDEEESS